MRGRSLALSCLIVIATTATLALTASSADAARPVLNDHTGPVYDSFADELCGITGTSATRFVGDFKLYDDGTFLSTSNFRNVFTADGSGKQIVISGVERVTGPFDPTDNGDGTITETFTFKGRPMTVSIEHGPTLVQDAGNETESITFLVNPDGSRGDVVSHTVMVERGPHPQLDDDALFCGVVVSALS